MRGTPLRSRPIGHAAALLVGVALLTSCASAAGAPSAASGGGQVAAPPTQPTFTVTRGSITDIIQSSGRVEATQQQVLYFRQSGHLNTLNVNLNDNVKAGQVLATLDTTALQKQIQQQQAAVEAAQLTVEKTKELQATTGSASGSSSTKAPAVTPQDVAAADAAVGSAQAAEDAAKANLAAISTPNGQAVEQAQAAVVQAQATLTKAQLRLQSLSAGPAAAEQQQATAAVASAQAKLDAAKQQLGAVQAGPTPAQVAQGRAALEQAQARFQAALAAYDAFQSGPTVAQRQQDALAVTQAKNGLYAAQTKRDSVCNNVGKTAPAAACQAADAAVNSAQSALDAAQKTLAQLGTVSPADRLAATAAYKQAEDKMTAAQQTYQEMLQGALPAASGAGSSGPVSHAVQVAQAQGGVQQAQAGVVAAQAALTALTPTANEVAQAQQAVNAAQAGVQSAQSQLQALIQPSAAAVRQAKDLVSQAAAGVTAAQAHAQQLREQVGQTSTNALDLAVQQNAVQQAQLGLEALQGQLSQMQIVAPFAGTIVTANGQAGADISAYQPVLTIANPKTLEVAVDLSPDQLTRVAMGQKANVTVRDFPGQNIEGTVTGLPSIVLAASNQDQNSPGAAAAQPGGRSNTTAAAPAVDPSAVTISATWPGSGVSIGEVANISISAETKSDVLLVPTQAINTTSNRTFVLVDQNGHQLPVDVQIGIQNSDLTEVQTGLKAGQKVFQRTG